MFRSERDLLDHIRASQGELSEVRDTEYKKNREYYENLQVPAGVPGDLKYIVKNKCLGWVNRQVSKIVGGKVTKTFKSPDKRSFPLEHLVDEILEKNNFYEQKVEIVANRFFVEGLGAFKLRFNPFKDSSFGLGFPEIHTPNPLCDEILLDHNSTDGTHVDDRVRASACDIPLSEALANPRWKDHHESIHSSSRSPKNHGDLEIVRIYDIEFWQKYYVLSFFDAETMSYFPVQRFIHAHDEDFDIKFGEKANTPFTGDFADDEEGMLKAAEIIKRNRIQSGIPVNEEITREEIAENTVYIETDILFQARSLDTDFLLEKPEKTDYAGFTTCVAMHTHRSINHKMPSSPLSALTDTQDRINASSSMMYQEAKKGIKNATVLSGVTYDEFTKFRRTIADIGVVYTVDNPNFRIHQIGQSNISPVLLQQFEIDHQAFDDVGETSGIDRGQQIDLSGKAIDLMQRRTDIPLYVPITHFSLCLKELFRRIVECVINQMDKPFFIQRKIDGEQKKIFFNFPVDRLPEGNNDEDDFDENMNFEIDGMINPLRGMKIPDIGVEIEPDTTAKESVDVQKAMASFDRKILSPLDVLKALYPNTWAEKYENMLESNQSMQIAAAIANLSQEAQQQVMQYLEQQAAADEIINEKKTERL